MCIKKAIIVQPPIVTIPQFKTWSVNRYYFVKLCKEQGLEPAELLKGAVLYDRIRYTTLENTDLLLMDLMPHLPKNSNDWVKFCWWRAAMSFSLCVERYNINAMAIVLDMRTELTVPNAHAYNVIATGDETGIHELLLFEPNPDYEWTGIVPWGSHNYNPELVLI